MPFIKSHHKEIEQLASLILYHKRLYYKGKSILSNEEYDALEEYLKKLSPHHPVLDYVGYQLTHQKQKIRHHVPMLSLAKTYSKDDLFTFLTAHECVGIDKFDGMALSLEYDDKGKLIQASTRGNGEFGENVTEHVYHILAIPKVLALPPALLKHRIEIRGEIYFPLSEFEKFADQFDSFRNAVPGTLGRKEVDEAANILHKFLFCPFDILIFDSDNSLLEAKVAAKLCGIHAKYSEKFYFMQTLGFKLLENFLFEINETKTHMLTKEKLDNLLESLFNKKRDHEIDGLVFRVEDEELWEKLGNTAHHPRGSLAFKRAGETAITEILDIEPNVGRSGKISFRAKLKPVVLSSAKISHATLHNADYIEKGDYDIGAQVKIIRSGEVIPAILMRVDGKKGHYKLPTKCLCGSPLERKGPDLWCSKRGSCEYSDQESLVYFVASMDMLGLSDKIVFKFREAGLVREPADFYKLTIEDILELEGFGEKSAQNIVKAIQSKKKVPLWQFLTALGLRRGGEVKCKEVARKFKTLENILNMTEENLLLEKGWAEKSAKDFIESLKSKHKIIQNLLKYVHVEHDDSEKNRVNNFFTGKNICITGSLSKPRSEIKNMLEKVGAKVVSGVSHTTDFLLCNETSDSTKYQEAKKLGIPVITETELMKHMKQ